jgi:hypothetical protein
MPEHDTNGPSALSRQMAPQKIGAACDREMPRQVHVAQVQKND